MSDITKLSELVNGDQQTVDLTTNTVVTDAVRVGGVGGTDLTQTVLDDLIASSGGSSAEKVDKFVLDSTDASNKFVILSFTPTTPGDTVLLVKNGPNLFYGSDFTVTGTQLSWSSLSLDGVLASGDELTVFYSSGAGISEKVNKFTLDGTDASNKFVTLTDTPATPGDTILLVEDAANMFYGVDFIVTGNQLSWSSLALDGILSSGDNLTIVYKT